MELEKEIRAYALKNAIEHDGKADPSRILPKLFQHGLESSQIKEILPEIKQIVKEINSLSVEKQKKLFYLQKHLIKEQEAQKEELPELPNIKKKPVFRLAPFPSGALHIGNAKTFILNWLYSKKYKGALLLVMDDTIGSEKKPLTPEAYDLIKDSFDYLGIDYKKPIIYKSDRLKIYYDYAKKLIEKEKAYVCHCSQAELKANREKGAECSCRQFPKDVQLLRWQHMFEDSPGESILRIKTNMQDLNPAFRDRVLFKISDREHPRTKKKYRVWPTLEMSWAVDDHLLNVTHIIRGNDLMIETEMEKYIWDIFKWEHPTTIHTGFLSLEGLGFEISKSKAQKEVKSGKFIGWHDPRTWSIQSLKQRGIKPEAIIKFVKEIGLNKQDISAPIETLYSINRQMIDADANRYSFVGNPIEIQIQNKPEIQSVGLPIHPDKEENKIVHLTNKIFISQDDFEKFKGKEIRLLHLYNIKLHSQKNKADFTSEENKDIPKVNWVSNFLKAEILMPDGSVKSGLAEENIKNLKENEMLQFERFGFARFDRHDKKTNTYHFWFAHK